MKTQIFNASLLIGWLMVTAGGMVLNLGAGLITGGVLLLALTLVVARMAGVKAAG